MHTDDARLLLRAVLPRIDAVDIDDSHEIHVAQDGQDYLVLNHVRHDIRVAPPNIGYNAWAAKVHGEIGAR